MMRASIGVAIVLGLVFASCQDYAFEELPSVDFNTKRWSTRISMASEADILFVVDNSRSMAGEQQQLGTSFGSFIGQIQSFFGDKYHIAVVTTGILSDGCPVCPDATTYSCMNETGEGGRMQERLGKNVGTEADPEYDFRTDQDCQRVMASTSKACFYDNDVGSANYQYGIALTGINGCGYERGLEAVRQALGDLTGGYNAGFLRPNATLAVVVISDEEDCGAIGEVTEGIANISGNICYYAAKGEDPSGSTLDPDGKPLTLTPVADYYNFLLDLKGGTQGMVKFAAVVGVSDVADPGSTEISYSLDSTGKHWDINAACVTPGCTASTEYCSASPGTRYIQLAQMFGLEQGQNGFIDTICQQDFSKTMTAIGALVGCPHKFTLSEEILDPALASILLNGEQIPRFTCSITGTVEVCAGEDDTSCSSGTCKPTWIYCPPDDSSPDAACQDLNYTGARGGFLVFADHYNPCDLFKEQPGAEVNIELVYVTR